MIAARLIGFVAPDWPVAMNLYFLIGFPLAAMTALWFLRQCGVSRLLAVTLATLYALAPYHFIRGESHLFLASYYAIPLALALLVHVLRGEPSRAGDAERDGAAGRCRPSARCGRLLIVALIAHVVVVATRCSSSSCLRRPAFSCSCATVAGGRSSGRRPPDSSLVGAVLVNMAPDLIYTFIHGNNPGGWSAPRARPSSTRSS